MLVSAIQGSESVTRMHISSRKIPPSVLYLIEFYTSTKKVLLLWFHRQGRWKFREARVFAWHHTANKAEKPSDWNSNVGSTSHVHGSSGCRGYSQSLHMVQVQVLQWLVSCVTSCWPLNLFELISFPAEMEEINNILPEVGQEDEMRWFVESLAWCPSPANVQYTWVAIIQVKVFSALWFLRSQNKDRDFIKQLLASNLTSFHQPWNSHIY